jgi:hypothetical protein
MPFFIVKSTYIVLLYHARYRVVLHYLVIKYMHYKTLNYSSLILFFTLSLSHFLLSDTQHPSIEELWMTKSSLDTLESLEPLRELPALVCVYLEHSPIAKVYVCCVVLCFVVLCCVVLCCVI